MQNETLFIFNRDLCQSLPLVFDQEVTSSGLPGYRLAESILDPRSFFKKWANPGLFSIYLFSVFPNKHYNFYNKSMWKMSILYTAPGFKPTTFEHESSPITLDQGSRPPRSCLVERDEQTDWPNSQTCKEWCHACATYFWGDLHTTIQQLTSWAHLLLLKSSTIQQSEYSVILSTLLWHFWL